MHVQQLQGKGVATLTNTIMNALDYVVSYPDPTLCEGKGLANFDTFIGCVGGAVS